MKTTLIKQIGFAAGLVGIVAVTGCGGSSKNLVSPPTSAVDHVYVQFDRLARPAVNEVFATVANNRHQINDQDSPTQDAGQLANDIHGFMTGVAGRSTAIADVVTKTLVGTTGDVEKADLSSTAAKGAYLGVETNGATGSTFGGRELSDDVIDTSLGVIFGNTVPALGLAPEDGKEIATLTTDNVDDGAKHFTSTFPYVGAPR